MEAALVRDAAALGFCRGVVRCLVEQPLETLRVRRQAAPPGVPLPGTLAFARGILHSDGVRGFYRGALVNCLRCACKDAYRIPVLVAVPQLLGRGVDAPQRSVGLRLTAGLTLAATEPLILCPLDRIKVFMMTSAATAVPTLPLGGRLAGVAAALGPRGLYRGFFALFCRQLAAWSAYIGLDTPIRNFFRRRGPRQAQGQRARDDARVLTPREQLCSALLLGFMHSALVLPFDAAQTLMQRAGSARGAVGDAWRAAGLRPFFRGFGPKLVQFYVAAALTVPLMEHLEVRAMRAPEGRGWTA